MAIIELTVPDIGDVSDAAVIELLVKPGDTIKAEQSLITIESDKASMEVPSSVGGVVKALRVKLGDKVSQGSIVAELETVEGGAAVVAPAASSAPAASAPAPAPSATPAAASTSAPASAAASASAAATASSVAPASPAALEAKPSPTAALAPVAAPESGHMAHASPSVRRFARELGVTLAQVAGTGPKGRITQLDVQDHVKGVMTGVMSGAVASASASAATPAGNGSGTGSADLGGMTLLPWPKVDFTRFGPIERQPLSRIQKISGANLHRNWVRIPHVTNNDEADITDLEAWRVALNTEHAKAGTKAREGKLTPAEMSGGNFSISSLGGFGGTTFTPIINAPEVAILGVCRAAMKPVWDGQAFQPRLMLPLSLSYDHRVIDGAMAAKFNAFLAALLADLRRALV
jgi:pyruvate dehydrogenase E2 component (dihydrolipoamide acetyltransferase)